MTTRGRPLEESLAAGTRAGDVVMMIPSSHLAGPASCWAGAIQDTVVSQRLPGSARYPADLDVAHVLVPVGAGVLLLAVGAAAHLRVPLAHAGRRRRLELPGAPAGPSPAARPPPDSTQAAWRAAPSATYSPGGGTSTGRPKMPGASCCTAGDRAAPPISSTRSTATPCATTASMPSASPQSRPSTAARAQYAGVDVRSVSPCTEPVARGRFGVRSPSR